MVRSHSWKSLFCVLLLLAALPLVLPAGNNNGTFGGRSVGGIAIGVDGVLSLPSVEDRKLDRDELLKQVNAPAAELNQPVEMRMLSLAKLEAAIHNARQKNEPLSNDIRYLAGLQRVQYVFVYPERNDIVLAGPGEGWKVDGSGNVIGVTTGLPVIHLEDLMVALRTVENARKGGILCSIDPTDSGIQAFANVSKAAGHMQPGVVKSLENALGQQNIRVEGVPASSHFARVLVASDYRMKRYAMELDPAPVKDLPSFLSLLKKNKAAIDNMLPRWWMACDYKPLAKSEDGLAWEIRGPGVKVLTESDVFQNGKLQQTGKSSPIAQQWAEACTAKLAALSVKDPVFGDLRNVMDLCVVAALLEREDMLGQVNLSLPNLRSSTTGAELTVYNVPKTVSTKCSVTKSGRDYIIMASGGVEINSWQVVEKSEVDSAMPKTRSKAISSAENNWWWN